MATNFKHSYKEFSAAAVAGRVRSMVELRRGFIETGADGLTVRFSTSNRKTGASVPSVSLIPVADCGNCKTCAAGCYDVRNVCFQKSVQISRAVNSAIYHSNPAQYFAAVRKFVRFARFFRWHVGGDLVNLDYFLNVVSIAVDTPACEFLIFTKEFDLVNSWLDAGNELPKNLHLIFSDWRGISMDNRHNLPVSSPVWFDKSGKEIERGPHCTAAAVWCPGSCEDCAAVCGGCWGLKNGETVLFEAH